MGSTRKKNAGRKRTLKYGGRRNYKKGSFKNRVKMTIRNGGGMKGGMLYRLNPKNNFKDDDTDDQIKEKLTRMFTYKIGEKERSSIRDHMIVSWVKYITNLERTDQPKFEKMTNLHRNIHMEQMQILPDSAESYSIRSHSPRKGEAGEAGPAEDPESYADILQRLQDEVDAEDLTDKLSDMGLKPQDSQVKPKSGSHSSSK